MQEICGLTGDPILQTACRLTCYHQVGNGSPNPPYLPREVILSTVRGCAYAGLKYVGDIGRGRLQNLCAESFVSSNGQII